MSNTPQALKDAIRSKALQLGFDAVGITSADPAEEAQERLQSWITGGYGASMHYMTRQSPRRGHPRDLLPEAQSVISLASNYFPGEQAGDTPADGSTMGKVARYALGVDYHKVLQRKLRLLENYLVELGGTEIRTKSFVDTAPLLEREFAQRAGLGFIGKNTHLINRRYGSWIFLSEILTSLSLPPDAPVNYNCGSCTLCLEACPTGALPEPFLLDSRKCISYWTIEHKTFFPDEVQPMLQDWVFGCDICQEVCPFNQKPKLTDEEAFQQGTVVHHRIVLGELLALDSEESFYSRLLRSPLLRPRREGIVRNALTVAVNQNAKELVPSIQKLAQNDPSGFVRHIAGWALSRLRSE